jgi:ATP-dependent DNA helicase PIF1
LPIENNLPCIVQSTYPDLQHKYTDVEYLKERTILSTTNETVDTLNDYILSFIPGNEKEYLSCDKIAKVPGSHESYDLLYLIEFLNSVNGNNFPQHRLLLKKAIPIMLLRNLNQSEGLCNGTRLVITSLGDMVIEAEIMFGQHKGKRVLIPPITHSENSKAPICFGKKAISN